VVDIYTPPLSSPLKGEEMDDGYSILKGGGDV